MNNVEEGKFGRRILSTDMILSGNKEQIKDLLQQISKAHGVSVEDAALALQNALHRLVTGEKPT